MLRERVVKSALLLEDNYVLGRALWRLLSEQGYKVTWAKNAMQAVDALLRTRFDFASLDYEVFGVATGLDVARAITELEPAQRPAYVQIHSSDDRGAGLMLALLLAGGVKAIRKEIA